MDRLEEMDGIDTRYECPNCGMSYRRGGGRAESGYCRACDAAIRRAEALRMEGLPSHHAYDLQPGC